MRHTARASHVPCVTRHAQKQGDSSVKEDWRKAGPSLSIWPSDKLKLEHAPASITVGSHRPAALVQLVDYRLWEIIRLSLLSIIACRLMLILFWQSMFGDVILRMK